MNNFKKIDLATYQRKTAFEFFQTFHSPHFHVSVKINAKPLYNFAKANNESFFLLCLYSILKAANSTPQMRQRIVNKEIIEFKYIAALTPILDCNECFAHIWCEYQDDFAAFKKDTLPKISAAKTGVESVPLNLTEDHIVASCLPWLHFESLTAAELSQEQSVQILSWGKMNDDGLIPFSCTFHHGLIDGLHASRFFAEIERQFNSAASFCH